MHGPAVGAGLVAGAAGRHLDRGEERAPHRRPHAPRRRRRRPRGDRLAAAVRHGEGEVLPAALRAGERRGGGADRPGFAWPVKKNELQAKGARGGAQARRRRADRAALDQVRRSTTGCAWPGRRSTPRSPTRCSGFTGPEAKEGIASHREKRAPKFPAGAEGFLGRACSESEASERLPRQGARPAAAAARRFFRAEQPLQLAARWRRCQGPRGRACRGGRAPAGRSASASDGRAGEPRSAARDDAVAAHARHLGSPGPG